MYQISLISPDLINLDSPYSVFRHSLSPSLTQTQGGDAHPLDQDRSVGTIWIPLLLFLLAFSRLPTDMSMVCFSRERELLKGGRKERRKGKKK